jgi:hypothetical protein
MVNTTILLDIQKKEVKPYKIKGKSNKNKHT